MHICAYIYIRQPVDGFYTVAAAFFFHERGGGPTPVERREICKGQQQPKIYGCPSCIPPAAAAATCLKANCSFATLVVDFSLFFFLLFFLLLSCVW